MPTIRPRSCRPRAPTSSAVLFKPTTGEGAEIGVKFKPVGSNLMLTAAVFELTQQNVLTADPTNLSSASRPAKCACGALSWKHAAISRGSWRSSAAYNKLIPRSPGAIAWLRRQLSCQHRARTGRVVGQVHLVRWPGRRPWDRRRRSLRRRELWRYRQYVPDPGLYPVRCHRQFRLRHICVRISKGWSAQINATNLTNNYYVSSCLTGSALLRSGSARTVLGTFKYAWN